MLLRDRYSRRVISIAPTFDYVLISTVTTNICQKTIEVLLQLGVIESEACTEGIRRQSGIDRIHLGGQFLIESYRDGLTAHDIHLAIVQGRHDVGV